MTTTVCTDILPPIANDTMLRHLMGNTYTNSIVYDIESRQWNRQTYDGHKLPHIPQMSSLAQHAVEKLESLNWMTHHKIIAIVGMVTDARMHAGWGRPALNATYCERGGGFVGNILVRDCRNGHITMPTPVCVRTYAVVANAPERGMIDFLSYIIDNSSFRRSIRTAHLAMRNQTR